MRYPCGVFHNPNSCLPITSQNAKRAQKHAGAICAERAPSCFRMLVSIDLFDCWTSVSATTWHTTSWHATTTCCLVHLHHDGVNDTFNLFLLGLELILFGQLIFVKPIQGVLHCGFNLFLVSTLPMVLQLVVRKCVPHLEAIVLQAVFRLDLLLVLLIFSTVLLCLLNPH